MELGLLPKRLLQINATLLCIGLVGLFAIGHSPFRSILWDESIWKGLVESIFGISWSDYVTGTFPIQLTRLFEIVSILFLAFGGWCCWSKPSNWGRRFLWVSAWLILILALWNWRSQAWRFPQLLEHGARVGSLFLIVGVFYEQWSRSRVIRFSEILVAATFVGHGLFALGWWPRPGHFVDMTIVLMQVSEDQAILFLQLVGWLDLITAVMILFRLPGSGLALWYMVFWGFATALARVVTNFYV
ncbi:MAG: hypothetical protein AAFV80_14650, partial [Bacteroidota bacterium]